MIARISQVDTIPLDQSQYYKRYAKDFDEGLVSEYQIDLSQLRLLLPEVSRKIWKRDAVKEAAAVWNASSEIPSNEAAANEAFKSAVQKAAQDNEFPRMFIRRFEQLRFDLYPVLLIGELRMYYDEVEDEKSPDQLDRKPDGKFFDARSYDRGRKWFAQLPLYPEDEVYVARSPEQTILTTWDKFLQYWDVFYYDGFITVNVINDNPKWFLFLHDERIVVWGCTSDYAIEKKITNTITVYSLADITSILTEIRTEEDRFYQSLVDEYHR